MIDESPVTPKSRHATTQRSASAHLHASYENKRSGRRSVGTFFFKATKKAKTQDPTSDGVEESTLLRRKRVFRE